MSRKLKYILSFSFLFLFGFGGAWLLERSHHSEMSPQNRMMASLKNRSTMSMEKHLMPVTIVLSGPEEIPANPDDMVELKAKLKTRFAQFKQIQYQWLLPEDVELIKGQINGDISNPEAQQEYEVTLLVKGFDKSERKEVSFVASTLDLNGQKVGNAAVITSRPEDSFEQIAPVVMVKAQEFKASQNDNRMPASSNDEE